MVQIQPDVNEKLRKMNAKLYAEMRRIEEAAAGRDFTDSEFSRTTELQDQIHDNGIANGLGEMHTHHTGTISPKRFAKLDKDNL